ncbi:tetratricopeptide repeat protein [Mangrovitalea sediminis]|uniref:tetratricopeptide repeat protein n=1 Tax=Mangrovitalea sediminis TaxID=1982043 RepID=UPI000BE5551B|nr:tetratricopeptide repeat protein [Mangrovitalea sediminis]
MNGKNLFQVSLLCAVIALPLAGCSKKPEKTKAQVEYLSHMDQARFFERQGELKASTQEARSAIRLQPQNAAPYLLIIDNLIIAGDATNAEESLKKLEKHLSENVNVADKNRIAIEWAKTELLKRDYDSALKHLDDVKTPESGVKDDLVKANNLRGQVLLAKGDTNGAKDAFEAAQKLNPNSVDAAVGLSKVAYFQGDKKQSQSLLSATLKDNPTNSDALLWKAQMAQNEKDYATAESAYMRALEDIGKYDIMTLQKYQTMSSLIQVLRAEGKIQQAYVYEEILAKSGPGIIIGYYESAIKAYKRGDLGEAANHLEEILKQSPGNQKATLLLGLIRYQQGKTQEAEKLLKPLEESGSSLEATKLLAASQIRSGQSQQAQKMLSELKGADSDPGVLALVGTAAISAGELNVGRQYIEKSLTLEPKNLTLRLRYGQWLMKQNDFNGAAAQAREAIKYAPDSVPAHRLEIAALLKGNQAEQAVEAAKAWRKSQPKNIYALLASGDLNALQKKTTQAFEDYQAAAKMDPKSAAPQMAMGHLMEVNGERAKALTYYKNAIELAPNDNAALSSLIRLTANDKKQIAQTVSFLRNEADKHPEATGPRIILMEYALDQGNFKESEALGDKVQALSKSKEGAERLMAMVYVNAAMNDLRAQKADQAGKVLDLADQRFPDNLQIGLARATVLFTQNNEDGALALLRQLKLKNPDTAQPYLVEAGYRLSKKQFDQAIELYKLALQKASSPATALQLATAQTLGGQPQNAIATLEDTAKQYPDVPETYLRLGIAYQNENKIDKAEQAYQQLLKLSPDQPAALNNLAWIYQQKGDKRAAETAKKAYEIQPDSAAIADTYGWILLKQGNAKASVPILEAAHQKAPDQKEIALHLAEAYKQTSQDKKAKAILEKF